MGRPRNSVYDREPPPVPVAMEQYSLNVEDASKSASLMRVSQEVFYGDRGEMSYDGISDSFICHLLITDGDREITHGGMLTDITDVWLVINSHLAERVKS